MPPGDTEFDSLVRRFGGHVYSHALRLLGNREDAEEATQDVFMSVYASLDGFRGDSELSTWIYRITASRCFSMRRKGKLKTKDVHGPDDPEALAVEDSSPDPEELATKTEDRSGIESMLPHLPSREAEVIILFYLEQMSYEEIAAVLRIPLGSVGTALRCGRERLRTLVVNGERGVQT